MLLTFFSQDIHRLSTEVIPGSSSALMSWNSGPFGSSSIILGQSHWIWNKVLKYFKKFEENSTEISSRCCKVRHFGDVTAQKLQAHQLVPSLSPVPTWKPTEEPIRILHQHLHMVHTIKDGECTSGFTVESLIFQWRYLNTAASTSYGSSSGRFEATASGEKTEQQPWNVRGLTQVV